MKTRKTLTKFLAITLAVAALATADLQGAGWVQPAKAQMLLGDGSVKFVSYASIGMVADERVRLSVANPKESGGTLTLSFSYYLAHGTNASSSVPLYQSEWIKVPPGEFRYSDVSHEDLGIDPGTARGQLLVGVSMFVPAGSDPEDFPTSLEIIKDGDQAGESVEPDTRYRLIIVAARRSKQLNVPVGFEPGERLHYTFLNPNEEGSKTVRVTTYTYDTYGNLLRQTDPLELQPGDLQAIDIKRDDLRVAGEERTGRLQVQTVIKVSSMDGSVQPVKLHVSMEHVNRTGSSSGGTYYTGTVSVSGDG